jgi:hypothetical protein
MRLTTGASAFPGITRVRVLDSVSASSNRSKRVVERALWRAQEKSEWMNGCLAAAHESPCSYGYRKGEEDWKDWIENSTPEDAVSAPDERGRFERKVKCHHSETLCQRRQVRRRLDSRCCVEWPKEAAMPKVNAPEKATACRNALRRRGARRYTW